MLPTAALAAGGGDVSPLTYQFMVFVIAIFVGYYVVWAVTPALHTPLMSVTNAISSVIVVGALLAVGVSLVAAGSLLAKVFGFLALAMASVNIFGGFLVTQRMLAHVQEERAEEVSVEPCPPTSSRCSISPPACCSFSPCAGCRARRARGAAICSA